MDFLDNYKKLKNATEDLSQYTLEELYELKRQSLLVYMEMDNMQIVIKRNCNSLYGSTGNEYWEFCDVDIAEDITTICRHFAILADVAMNTFFTTWGNDKSCLEKIQEFYPNVTKLNNFKYIRDCGTNDLCIYGDTDSRYINLDLIYQLMGIPLPPTTEEGNQELADFSVFLDKNFLQNIITTAINKDLDYRNGRKGFLKMAHEVTTRKSVLIAKKMYIMTLIWKDGKFFKRPKMKYMGVSIKRGETTPQLKKISEKLIEKYLIDEYTKEKISRECFKIVTLIKRKGQKHIVCSATTVSGVKNLTLEKDESGKEFYTIGKNHLQAQLIVNWANFLKDNNLEKEYRHAFEKQKMFYYKTLSSKYPVIGVPDDVDIDSVPNMPPIDWTAMINQTFLKPLMKILFEYEKDYKITDDDCNNFLTGIFINKITF